MMKKLHAHPSGLKFKRGDVQNKAAFDTTCWLVAIGATGENGWHSWRDVKEHSAEFGRWVLFNVRTHETYIEVKCD